MPAFTVDTRAAGVLGMLRNGEKRTAYAVVNALNDTAKAVQAAERQRVARVFHLRKRDFVLRQAAIIRPFASVKRGVMHVRVATGEKPRLLIHRFEHGGRRGPFVGKNVAVPVSGGPARPSAGASVPTAFTFRALRFARAPRAGAGGRRRGNATFTAHTTRAGKTVWRGTNRTFILSSTARAPHGGVFQRVGPGRDNVRMVYSFAPSVPLDSRLKFVPTAVEVTAREFAPRLLREVKATLKRNLLGAR